MNGIKPFEIPSLKVNESRYKQCGVIPHFSTRQNLLKKMLRKININTINKEILFNRSADNS